MESKIPSATLKLRDSELESQHPENAGPSGNSLDDKAEAPFGSLNFSLREKASGDMSSEENIYSWYSCHNTRSN